MVCGDDIYFDNDNVVESEDIELYRYNGIPKNGSIYRNMVIKHSPNIIDLIEVGDYVNGLLVYEIVKTNKKHILYCIGEFVPGGIQKNEIKSVVTKEQFKNMKYVVGDK